VPKSRYHCFRIRMLSVAWANFSLLRTTQVIQRAALIGEELVYWPSNVFRLDIDDLVLMPDSPNFLTIVLRQCFSKWAESPPWGDFEWQGGDKSKGGNRGAKQHKGGENAQPIIDQWVNFSSLILWLVSFWQILFYYDIIFGGCCCSNLSVKFLLWIVYVPGYSVDYSGLRSHHKDDTSPTPELLVFMSVALTSELSFFVAPDSGRIHTLMFCWLGVPQVE